MALYTNTTKHLIYQIGLNEKSEFTNQVFYYTQSLRLSSAACRSATTGEICNLMSVDAQKLQDAPAYMHQVWSTPLTIALAIYFLWQQLGPSVMAGLALMILLVPVNGLIAQKTRKLQVLT
jgi:ATP-binding cassette subfamily C (CFTR/MRP) protein 1